MPRGRFLLLGLGLLLLTAGALSQDNDAPPRPFVATYQLSRNDLPVGQTRLEWQLTPGGGYRYRARTEPRGPLALIREDLILEESRGHLIDGRPRPDYYQYRRTGTASNRHLELTFDWPQNRVRIAETRSHWSLTMPPETLDKLVQQWQVSRDLANGVRDPEYTVADGGRLKQYRYRTLGRERLDTPLGPMDTLKLERRKDNGAADYTLWLAEVLNYQPVRILRQHGEHTYLMELAGLEP
jgi:hypothetical protein